MSFNKCVHVITTKIKIEKIYIIPKKFLLASLQLIPPNNH